MTKTPALALVLAAVAALASCTKEDVCPKDQLSCGGTCVAVRTDPAHCGTCGNVCGEGLSCSAGQCISTPSSVGLFLACGNTDQIAQATGSLEAAGGVFTVGTRPVSLTWLDGSTLYSSNSLSGTVSELRLDLPVPGGVGVSRTFTVDATSAFPDLEYVAANGGLLYVSNASLTTLDVIDPGTGTVLAQTVLDLQNPFAGPAGIAFANGKAYVAMNFADSIAVLDVSTCQPSPPACGAGNDCSAHAGTACVNGFCVATACASLRGHIALPSSLASTATGPTPNRLLVSGSRMYVTLQNLDRTTQGFLPAGEGRLAIVDLATDTLVQDAAGAPLAVSLGSACQNPGGFALHGDTLWITCGFYDAFFTKARSGMAIVPVSVAAPTPIARDPIVLEHTVAPAAICGGALYAGASDSGDLLRYDLGSGILTSATLCPIDSNGNAYVADLTCRP